MGKKTVFAAVALAVFAGWRWVSGAGDAVVTDALVRVTVPQGAALATLPDWFPGRAFPVSDWRYRAWLKWNARGRKLQAGDHVVLAGTTLDKLVSVLSANPEGRDVRATLLPGWNLADYDAALAAAGVSRAGELLERNAELAASLSKKYAFLKGVPTLEGLLAPDTYAFDPAAGLGAAADRMLAAFQKGAPEGFFDRKDWYAELTMASILEKEERDPAEQPTVAGILWKRLRTVPAFLAADATVCYEKILRQKDCQAFVNSHYARPRAEREALGYRYDTRARTGLPPTPVSSVKFSTLRSALAPAASDWWFYLHDSEGRVRYARTIEEHAENKRKYLY